jgi:hypothetical protein
MLRTKCANGPDTAGFAHLIPSPHSQFAEPGVGKALPGDRHIWVVSDADMKLQAG